MKCFDQIYTFLPFCQLCLYLSYHAFFFLCSNPRVVIVKCNGCAYDVDVYVDVVVAPIVCRGIVFGPWFVMQYFLVLQPPR